MSTVGMITGLTAPVATGLPASAPTARQGSAKTVSSAQQTVTLITGDTVTVSTAPDGKQAVEVAQGKGRDEVNFVSSDDGKEVSVVPEDALPLLQAGKLDPALFNVTRLTRQGYGDARTGSIPLIATYRGAGSARSAEAPDGARKRLTLPRSAAAALSARKTEATAFWKDIAPEPGANPLLGRKNPTLGGGIEKLWLDARVKAALDVSVPQIGAPEVWQGGYDGKGVKVAVLDTGIDLKHPDVTGRVAGSESFVPEVTSVQDGHGHGTHVASTIVGSGAASGGKYKGVAPGAELFVGKVLDDTGYGYASAIMAGMEWAASSGADIVSMSLGGAASGPSDVLSETVDALSAGDGPLFVIAAGNSGPFEKTIGTPGIADSALTVGAVNKSDALASFSSRGPRLGDSAVKPEITAPGVGIVAARAAGTAMGTPVDGDYTAANGTSMATPHVAGAAALVSQAHPDWTSAQLKAALASTAKTSASYTVFQQGDGRVDVARAALQNVFATPTLNYGLFRHADSEPVVKELAYTNATDEPVTLKVSTTLTDASLSLGADTVTVPAHGTASVPVTVDPTKAKVARHAGRVTATTEDGRGTVTTAVAYEREALLYDLKVNLIDREGNPSPSAMYTMQELGWKRPNEFGSMSADRTWRVPAGTYSLATWIPVLDAGNHQVGLSVVGDPEIKVTGDTALTLDARKAKRLKPVTKEGENAEARRVTTSWHREREGGSTFGLNYTTGPWVKDFYVAPTERVTDGLFEFHSKWRLYEKELTASVTSPRRITLSPMYMSTYDIPFPVKIDGRRKVQAVYAGDGSAKAFEDLKAKGVNVKGKAVLVGLAPDGWPDEAGANAEAAGAAYLLAYRKAPGFWLGGIDTTTIPALSLPGEQGEQLASLITSSGNKPVTLELGGTSVSPYAYHLVLPQPGAISADGLTPRIDSSNTAKVTARYHAAAEGQMGEELHFTFRPWQTIDVGSAVDMPVGVKRTEYYSSGDTRYWHQPSQHYTGAGGQSATLRTYEPGNAGTQEWFGPLQRPATEAEFESTVRDGDTISVRIPEFSDSLPGHYGNGPEAGTDTVRTTLFADGKPVGEAADGWGDFAVPADETAYRLTMDTARTAGWTANSTSTHTEWGFTSARTEQAAALPLLSVDYDLDSVDLLGRARAGDRFGIGLKIRQQEGAEESRTRNLKAWVSYDDGVTWKEVRTERRGHREFKAMVNHPSAQRTNGYVALRIQASDARGNRIDQTVLRAYGLRR